jgi:hypothetical protein
MGSGWRITEVKKASRAKLAITTIAIMMGIEITPLITAGQ